MVQWLRNLPADAGDTDSGRSHRQLHDGWRQTRMDSLAGSCPKQMLVRELALPSHHPLSHFWTTDEVQWGSFDTINKASGLQWLSLL